MNEAEKYHKWVEWSEEDKVYLGKCPDLITGIHGNDARQVFNDLLQTIDEVILALNEGNLPLPPAKVRPMQEVS